MQMDLDLDSNSVDTNNTNIDINNTNIDYNYKSSAHLPPFNTDYKQRFRRLPSIPNHSTQLTYPYHIGQNSTSIQVMENLQYIFQKMKTK